MVIAIVRVRGTSGIKPDIRKTMELLRIRRKHHCVVYKDETVSLKGMLNACRDYVTWGTVSKDTIEALVEKRGRLPGNKRLPAAVAEKAAVAIEKGEDTGIKPVFRLSPPKKGWKSVKHAYPKGALGPRGDKMDELLKRMI